MRPSDFFVDGTDDFEDGNDKRPLESSRPNHSRSFGMFLKNALPTDGPTDRRTKSHMEMQGRI